jgi:hypothetical protein
MAWLLAVFNPIGRQEIKYSIVIDEQVKDKWISLSDSLFVVHIRDAKTLSFWHSTMNADKIVLREEDFADNKGEINLKKLLLKRIGNKNKLSFVTTPRSISYTIIEVVEKELNIEAKPYILPRNGWEVAGKLTTIPAKIYVQGEKRIVETLDKVELVAQKLKETSEEQELVLKLRLPPSIRSKTKSIRTSFYAKRFITKNIPLVIPVGKLGDKRVKLLPAQVTLEVKIPLLEMNNIGAEDFLLGLDTTGLYQNKPLQVIVKKKPGIVKEIHILPPEIDYVFLVN